MIDKNKEYRNILYDHSDGQRYLIRISLFEIDTAVMGSFDRVIVYDLLEDKEKTLPHVLAYLIVRKGIYLE